VQSAPRLHVQHTFTLHHAFDPYATIPETAPAPVPGPVEAPAASRSCISFDGGPRSQREPTQQPREPNDDDDGRWSGLEKRTARERAKDSLQSLLAMDAENYVELAFEAQAGRTQYDDVSIAAAKAYDERHVKLVSRGHQHLIALEGDPTCSRLLHSESISRRSLSRHRFFINEPAGGPVQAIVRKVRKRRKPRWQLEDSIWAPRQLWGNSRDFFETPEALRKMFLADWNVAVRAHDLGWLIVKSHHDPTTWRDIDKNGTHDEIDEVSDALWKHHRVVYGIFEYYSTLYSDVETSSGEPDVYAMSFNGWMRFVAECRLISKRVTHSEFEVIWAIVNAADRATASEDRFNSKSALNRQEFMQCLVRCAITVYVQRGTIGDVSDAVTQLLSSLTSCLPPAAMQNSNAFRKRFCYVEKTTLVLEAHMRSVMSLYEAYAEVSHGMDDLLRNDSLMSVGEWLTFCTHVGLLESGQITSLTAKKIFMWSRIRTAADLTEASEMKLRHLTPTDFLEALVRLSLLLALPTDLEVEEAGAADAGEFLLAMQTHSPREYMSFLTTHRPKYTDPDGSDYEKHALQPADRCMEHLLRLIIRTVEHNTSASAGRHAGGTIDGTVEAFEAAKFLKRRQANFKLSRFEANEDLAGLDFGETLDNAASKKLQTAAAITIQLLMRARKARQMVAERKARKAAKAAEEEAAAFVAEADEGHSEADEP